MEAAALHQALPASLQKMERDWTNRLSQELWAPVALELETKRPHRSGSRFQIPEKLAKLSKLERDRLAIAGEEQLAAPQLPVALELMQRQQE